MVSGINSRQWVGGLSSGLDTQALIETMIRAESFQKFALERKRNTLVTQKELLQEVNMRLFDLQSKATDLTFSRTFNSKKVDASNSRIVNARANTDAQIGSYTVHVKQLATKTSVASDKKLAGSLEKGHHLLSNTTMGGASTILGALGSSGGNIKVSVTHGSGGSIDFNVGASANTSISDFIDSLNSEISLNDSLSGKLKATYDDKNNQVKFNLLDSAIAVEIEDISGGDIIANLFDPSGKVELNRNKPVAYSDMASINTGLNTKLADMGIELGFLGITRGITGTETVFDLSTASSGLTSNSTVSELMDFLNHKIDTTPEFVKNGNLTGNPKNRLLEFRFSNDRIELVNTNAADDTQFHITDEPMSYSPYDGNLTSVLFGNSIAVSTFDSGRTLAEESFALAITSGTITIDGVQIKVDPSQDTLHGLLSRITALSNVEASYDSRTDLIKLTRKNGSNIPIGIGSSTDTSNFLAVTGLISGSQASAAEISSYGTLGLSLTDANNKKLEESLGLGESGSLKIKIDGVSHYVDYDHQNDSISDVLDRIKLLDGIDNAFYDASTGRVKIIGTSKGASASIEVSDVGSGTLANVLKINDGAANGKEIGSSLVSAKPISDIRISDPLDNAGFVDPVTSGFFTINGVKFTVGDTSRLSLNQIITNINENDEAGVSAYYDHNLGQMVLTSKESGNRSIAIGSAEDTSNFLSAIGLTGSNQKIGLNAIYSIDELFGGTQQVSQGNVISDAIQGVTFELNNVTEPGGETIAIEADTEMSRKAVDDFIEAYNEVAGMIYARLTEERDYELEALTDEEKSALGEADLKIYEEAFKIGLLSGDNTLRTARSQMRLIMSSVVPGVDEVLNSLAQIGITTGVVGSDYRDTMEGLLRVTDEDKLNTALSESPDKVFKLFANDSDDANKKGIARRLREALNEFTKTDGLLTSRVGRSGINSTNSQFDRMIGQVNTQILSQQERLMSREEALLKQFTQLETALAGYQSQAESFAGQLAQLQR